LVQFAGLKSITSLPKKRPHHLIWYGPVDNKNLFELYDRYIQVFSPNYLGALKMAFLLKKWGEFGWRDENS
jgi:hypothetical protein